MTRALRGIYQGRLRVWCMSHGQQFRLALGLVTLVVAFGLVGKWDYEDQLAEEKSAREEVTEQLRQERIGRALPSTVYIIEAATPAEAQSKFAQIADGTDTERYRLWSVTK